MPHPSRQSAPNTCVTHNLISVHSGGATEHSPPTSCHPRSVEGGVPHIHGTECVEARFPPSVQYALHSRPKIQRAYSYKAYRALTVAWFRHLGCLKTAYIPRVHITRDRTRASCVLRPYPIQYTIACHTYSQVHRYESPSPTFTSCVQLVRVRRLRHRPTIRRLLRLLLLRR